MSINAIRLLNFRGFRDARIELKPLTVLMGSNSSGKSSFGHALAAMSHAHRIFAGTPQATLTPTANDVDNWPIDLGDLNDLRTCESVGPVTIRFETTSGEMAIGFGLDKVQGLLPSYFSIPRGGANEGEDPQSRKVSDFQRAPSGVYTGTGEKHVTVVQEKNQSYEVRRLNENQWHEGGSPSIVILEGLLLRAITHATGTPRLLSGAAQSDVKLLLDNLTYLRATRKRPSRTYKQDVGTPQAIGYSGEWTATLLSRFANESVIYAKLPEIPDTVEQARERLLEDTTRVRTTLATAVQHWLEKLKLATSLRSTPSKRHSNALEVIVEFSDQHPHNIVEIGFGLSQVLPVLVAGLLQPTNSLFVVDLPEAHLHPRPQSDLADFFCSLAMSDRYALVETHSEMFFHRLRLRAEMDESLKKRMAVYFIDSPQNGICQEPRPVGLGFEQQLHWPAGFLQEAWEEEAQIEAVRQAKASKTK